MLKKSLLLAVGALAVQGALADTLTPDQALQRMQSESAARRVIATGTRPELVYTAVTTLGQPAVYVFNREGGGTIFLSADDLALPMLGYTDDGAFNPTDIPPVIEYWLGEYARQIEYAKSHGYENSVSPRMDYPTSWTYVAPLISTRWDQGNPYNLQTPEVNGAHTPTGCVATAAAQIMKYWNYPSVGKGNKSYRWSGKNLSMNFSNYPFDWSNMLDTYSQGKYNDTQANAVSLLMKAIGYGCEMDYGASGSGTQTALAGTALVNYFSYDSSIKYDMRVLHSDMEWTETVYNELKNGRPAIYDGSSPGGGHAFVVDGYDGNGYFHINWGWGGLCNGYYLLTALNPTQQGTGGSMGGYNYGQGLLYNIKKAEGDQKPLEGFLTMCGNLSAFVSGSTITFSLSDWNDPAPGFLNLSFIPVKPTFGIEIQNADGSGDVTVIKGTAYSNTLEVGRYLGSNFRPTAGLPSGLANGRYKVTLVYQNAAVSNPQWQHFRPSSGMHDYVYVTKNGNTYTVENLPFEIFTVNKAEIKTPLYWGYPFQLEVSLTNNYNEELSQTFVPTLSDGGVVYYEADSQIVVVPAGQTVTKTLVYKFDQVKTGMTPSSVNPVTLTLGAFDHNTGTQYGTFGQVTMSRSGASPKVSCSDFSITNASGESNGWYGVPDFSNMKVSATVSVTNSSFLASPLTCVVYETNENGVSSTQVYEKEFENYVYLGSGDSATESTTLNFTDYNPWMVYNLSLYYLDGTTRKLLKTIKFSTSGVNDVLGDEDLTLFCSGNLVNAASGAGVKSIEVYDAKGARIAAIASDSLDISSLGSGLYLVRATDAAGNSKVIKVVK